MSEPTDHDTADLPLDGVRVLDLSALTPGPFATVMLAELGATVIKVERPRTGDPLRQMLPQSFQMLNRGKLSLELDLKDDEDRQVLLRLCEGADAFVEGFRPGVADRLGVGFEQVRARSPRIVYLSLSSYGQSGPLAQVPGHDLNFVARAGGLRVDGDVGPVPRYGTYQVADLAASAYAVIGILAALGARPRVSRHLDLSLLGAALGFTQLAVAEAADVHGGPPESARSAQRAANGVFVAGDDVPITVCAVEDQFWRALCQVLDLPGLAGRDDLSTYADRLINGDEVNEAVSARLRTRSSHEWLAAMYEAGIPVAPVLTPADALEDAQVRELALAEDSHPAVSLPLVGLPVASLWRSPGLGADSGSVRAHGWSAGPSHNRDGGDGR